MLFLQRWFVLLGDRMAVDFYMIPKKKKVMQILPGTTYGFDI